MHWSARCNWSRSVLVYVCVKAGDMEPQAIAHLAGQSVRYRTLEAESGPWWAMVRLRAPAQESATTLSDCSASHPPDTGCGAIQLLAPILRAKVRRAWRDEQLPSCLSRVQ